MSDYPYVTLTVLGSGTSVGVPSIGCHCDVCSSADPRDNRLRASVWLNFAGKSVIIDTSPDFRAQSLRAGIRSLDVLFLDALRYKPHPTHSSVDQSLAIVERLKPKTAYFTHLCHDIGHERAESLLPPNVFLAYDGLRVEALL